ncbi:autoinducer-2 (AI-2) modifying protein LsrG [Halovulum dunhuangense]|uniref:Autoinducer-2 (AI-2) modifying protein LsrG n=1 Tax=Halovulum dunhuangense TaxID=1505036 RepID=A0A849L0T2_9RHOB|nr:antibiotic biosynthesis monooxygenase [Halovulum dunhuangense]NNU79886.1 autoinducer-2 (AI-2) modifying protein LsrG [Halovulum dunhuangense]
MFVQIVRINVKPDRVEDFLDAFRLNYEGTIREPGNVRFDVLQDPEDETRFTIYEVFTSAEAVDEHRKTEHYKETVARLDDIMTGNRTKEVFDLVMSDKLSA